MPALFSSRLRQLAALALVCGLSACGPAKPPAAGAAAGPGAGGPPPAMPVGVKVAKVEAVPVLMEAVGQAEGSKEVDVRARVGGLIQKQSYAEGERVKRGAPLFAIERAPFEIALSQARAALSQEEARAEQARREAARLKPLAAQQAISQREADDAATAQRLTEGTVAAARARVREAELNLSYTAVTAPIAGIVGRAEKSEGSLVGTADGLLTHITQTDPIWVRFSLSEPEQALLRRARGSSAVRLLAADGKPMNASGKLNFKGSTVDARLGTVALRAEFANPELTVLPGQFVRAQVQAGTEQAVLVPQAAVMSGDRGKMVWTIQDGKATPTPVEVGGWVGADWVVRKGLKDGDAVVIDNLLKIRPGAPLMVRPAEAAAAAPASAPAAAAAAVAASR
jgi:membrane fusion protein, multidrug efflux system